MSRCSISRNEYFRPQGRDPCAACLTRLYLRSAPSEEMQKGLLGGRLAYCRPAFEAGTSASSVDTLTHEGTDSECGSLSIHVK